MLRVRTASRSRLAYGSAAPYRVTVFADRVLDPAQVVVNAFQPVLDEVDTELEITEGALPAGLEGVIYRNGPGRLDVHGTRLTHPFDGDGMVSRFELRQGRVFYRNRYVRTDEFRQEALSGKALYRNFGTNLPGGLWANFLRLKFKNPANTSVLYEGEQLLALWEGGQPHALDPNTLQTRGRFDFDGRLSTTGLARILAPEPPFSAHPRRCAKTGALYNFGIQVAPNPTLRLYHLSDGQLLSTREITLPGVSFMHDFVLTETYAVFFVTPVQFDVARALIGFASPVECLRRTPDVPSQILLVPRSGGPVRWLAAEQGFFLFHFFNAYDDGDEVVVDGCRMADFPGGTVDLGDVQAVRDLILDPGYPTRWRINPRQESVDERQVGEVPLELPTVDPRRAAQYHRYGYATARLRSGPPLYTGLARLDFESSQLSTVDLAPDLPGEPLVVPLQSPDETVLATVVYRAREHVSELQLRDSGTLGIIMRARLPHHQPPGFHGCFVPATR